MNYLISLLILFFIVIFLIWYSVPFMYTRGFSKLNAAYIEPQEFPNFITNEENDYILQSAKSSFKRSSVLFGSSTKRRVSDNAWLYLNDPVIYNIVARVCHLTNIHPSHSEAMQVVRYKKGGYYKPHHDASCTPIYESMKFEKIGGQRIVTMIIYLNDNFKGGETNFPNLKKEFKPEKNKGLLFYPLERDGRKCHPKALHGGKEILEGEKYIATIWLREKRIK